MAKTSVVPATQELVDRLKGRLREADIKEVFAASGEAAEWALQLGFQLSEFCWVGLLEDLPVCCFGARRTSMVGGRGIVWLLGTEELRNVKKVFVKQSVLYVDHLRQQFDILENWVDARNDLSIKWLRWCGFEFEKDPKPFGKFQLPFYHFWLRRV